MLKWLPLIAIPLLGACTEYDLVGDGAVFGEPNPQDLSTPVRTDKIVQVTVPSVDVLWVIDNSCSMYEEQAALAGNFSKFMQYFLDSGLDYHIGVITTDMDSNSHKGKLVGSGGYKFIDPLTPDPITVFGSMAVAGTSGSASEKGRAAAYSAVELRGDTDNFGFYREDANLAVIVISDENDYSGANPIPLIPFIDWLGALKQFEDQVVFSAIVGEQSVGPGSNQTCPTAYEPGHDYLAVTRAFNGIEWSVCDDRWDLALQQLGMQAAGLRREFFLSEVPIEESIDVWVEEDGVDLEVTLEWTYDRGRNSVTLSNYIPEPLQQVFINYEILAAAQ